MEKTLSYNPHIERTLALSNLSQKKYRTVLIGILVAVQIREQCAHVGAGDIDIAVAGGYILVFAR